MHGETEGILAFTKKRDRFVSPVYAFAFVVGCDHLPVESLYPGAADFHRGLNALGASGAVRGKIGGFEKGAKWMSR